MNKYSKIPEHVIDLHRHTTSEVKAILDSVISENDYAHVRIITGKGTHGLGGAVVRTFVKAYLNARGIRFNPSKIQDGGEGALEVFIKEK